MTRLWLFIAIWLLAALPARAQQDAATLIADSLRVTGDDTLVAEGDVEVIFGTRRLSARRIVYDGQTARLTIEGPLVLVDGGTVLEGAEARIDEDLRNGLLRSARLVLEQQVQIAAAEIARVEGRYTQMYRTVATSCRICEEGAAPLWSIRAERVIHDEKARQLYFDKAQLRVLDVPVLYLPRLRLPDPTLKRATGFMIPRIRSTSQLGTGLKIPYFIMIGDHADLTLTPYLSSETRTLEFRYRQAFAAGDIRIDGAVSGDTILPSKSRGYLFLDGAFDLERDFKLEFDIEASSDDSYLLDYGYSSDDRLDSQIALTRTRRDADLLATLIHFQSLREDEDNATIPTIVGDVIYERRLTPAPVGGDLRLRAEAHTHYRYSNDDGAGRDVTRLTSRAEWDRDWIVGPGLRATLMGALYSDLHLIRQDDSFDEAVAQLTPYAGVELRWPLARTGAGGARHIVEPVVQVVWSDTTGNSVPNEDSTRVEFDEGNLFAFSRFPGADRRERGTRANLGLTWTRVDPAGWQGSLSLGKVYRDIAAESFTESAGLGGKTSDWLISGSLDLSNGLNLLNRTILNDGLSATKNETRIRWANDRLSAAATYTWLASDVLENRSDAVSEWNLDSRYRLNRHWTGAVDWRYDFVSARTAQAGVGLEYRNECVEIDLSLSRRFTSSDTLEPSTDFGFSVSLAGFSTGANARSYARSCKK